MRGETRIFLVYVVIFLIFGLIVYYVFSSDLLVGLYNVESARNLLLAIKEGMGLFIVAFVSFCAGISLPKVFAGIGVNRISKALIIFAGLLIMQLVIQVVLICSFVPLEIQNLSYLFLFVEVTILVLTVSYYISKDYNQRYIPKLIQALIFFVLALSVWEIILKVPFDYNYQLATAVSVGLVVSGVTVFFYPLRSSKNRGLKKIGIWISSSTLYVFLLIVFLTLYLVLLRPYLFNLNSVLFLLENGFLLDS